MKKFSNLMDIKLDSEAIYGNHDKDITTKITIYGDKVNTNFQCKKIHQTKMLHINTCH